MVLQQVSDVGGVRTDIAGAEVEVLAVVGWKVPDTLHATQSNTLSAQQPPLLLDFRRIPVLQHAACIHVRYGKLQCSPSVRLLTPVAAQHCCHSAAQGSQTVAPIAASVPHTTFAADCCFVYCQNGRQTAVWLCTACSLQYSCATVLQLWSYLTAAAPGHAINKFT